MVGPVLTAALWGAESREKKREEGSDDATGSLSLLCLAAATVIVTLRHFPIEPFLWKRHSCLLPCREQLHFEFLTIF